MSIKKEYRTTEQYTEIVESVLNGNFRQAAIEVVEYGFFSSDLIQKYEEAKKMEYLNMEATDLCIITEMATVIRYCEKQ